MRLNSDFKQRIVIRPSDYKWVRSPMLGVERMMLDRIGEEVARATSLVRYSAHSQFNSHVHGGGEEFLVLQGEFADEHGKYPEGTYVRNPVGTEHTPMIGSSGAIIFVKLHQFREGDNEKKVLDSKAAEWLPGLVSGLQVLHLHNFETEAASLVRWAPNTQFQTHRHWGGEEIFVVDGVFFDEHGEYPAGTWIRSPHLSEHRPFTKEKGAIIFVKTGHLPDR